MFLHDPRSRANFGCRCHSALANKHRSRPARGGLNAPPRSVNLTIAITGNKNDIDIDINGLIDASSALNPVGSVDLDVDGNENALRLGSATSRTRARGWFSGKVLSLVIEVVGLVLAA